MSGPKCVKCGRSPCDPETCIQGPVAKTPNPRCVVCDREHCDPETCKPIQCAMLEILGGLTVVPKSGPGTVIELPYTPPKSDPLEDVFPTKPDDGSCNQDTEDVSGGDA